MSNYLAIAAITETLRTFLDQIAKDTVTGANATVGRPEKSQDNHAPDTATAGINIFLFQVAPNPTFRNADLPAYRSDGSLVQRPQVALNLYYLLTFSGQDIYQEPQRLLGKTVSALHDEPLLTEARIQAMIQDAIDSGNPEMLYIADSDLAQQIEGVRFTPLGLNLEELSKLWSVFFQIPYSLSIAYQASVVLIESERTPQRALPVQKRKVYAVPFQKPLITAVQAQSGSQDPIYHDSTLMIEGQRLRGQYTKVQFGEIEVTPDAANLRMTSIQVALPAGLSAGIQGVQVLHEIEMGDPASLHAGFSSNVHPFILRPRLSIDHANVTASALPIEFEPQVEQKQRVKLFLNEYGAPDTRRPFAYSFDAPANNSISPPDTKTGKITFTIADVVPGNYLVQVQVDGAENELAFGADKRYEQPQVSIP